MITQTNMVRVAMMKKKHLEQVPVISYDYHTYAKLTTDLLSGVLKVLYWFDGTAKGSTYLRKMWLIEGPTDGQYHTMVPPGEKDHEGKPSPLWEKFKDVPQLFID